MFQRHIPGRHDLRLSVLGTAVAALAIMLAAGAYLALRARPVEASESPAAPAPAATQRSAAEVQSVQLTDAQLKSITVGTVNDHDFEVRKEAVGSIDFNENFSVQVFTPYAGRIIDTFADLGDEVKKGQTLFTIESPDFLLAESTLISAAATYDQAQSAFERARKLYADHAIDQNDYETAVANQQSAEGALKAAREGVAIFGRTPPEIDRIVASRQVDRALIVKSPVSGRVTGRAAAPGLLVQPGNTPAPFAIADLSTVWMLANVLESDSPLFKLGQDVAVSVAAYPGRIFRGKLTAIGTTVDPNSRRVTLRSEIKDPSHELRPGMFANFVIRTGEPVRAPGVPLNGVVREGDGTMSVWVVADDRHRFVRRIVKIGLLRDGYQQIVDGLKSGEEIAVDGAILLSNIVFGGAS